MKDLTRRLISFLQLTSGIIGFAALAVGLVFMVLESQIDNGLLRAVGYALAEPLSYCGMVALAVFAVCLLVNRLGQQSADPD